MFDSTCLLGLGLSLDINLDQYLDPDWAKMPDPDSNETGSETLQKNVNYKKLNQEIR